MSIVTAIIFGLLGMLAGWFIPTIAEKTAKYKYSKQEKELNPDSRYISFLLKLGCLLLTGISWAALGYFLANPFHAALLAVIILDAIVIAIVDLRIHIIPNETVFVMAVIGIIFQITFFGFAAFELTLISAVGVMIVFIILASILGLRAIGAGDVKLVGAMGLLLGWPYIFYGLFGMSIIVLIWSVVGLITKKLKLNSMLPFGPFMMAGTVFAIALIILGY